MSRCCRSSPSECGCRHFWAERPSVAPCALSLLRYPFGELASKNLVLPVGTVRFQEGAQALGQLEPDLCPSFAPQGNWEHQPRSAPLAALTEAQTQQGLLPAGGGPAVTSAGQGLCSHRNSSCLAVPSLFSSAYLLMVVIKCSLVVSLLPWAARACGGTRASLTSVFCCTSSMHECWTAGERVGVFLFLSPLPAD